MANTSDVEIKKFLENCGDPAKKRENPFNCWKTKYELAIEKYGPSAERYIVRISKTDIPNDARTKAAEMVTQEYRATAESDRQCREERRADTALWYSKVAIGVSVIVVFILIIAIVSD